MHEPHTPFRNCTDLEVANMLEAEHLRDSDTPSVRYEQLVAEAIYRFLRYAETSDN